MARYGRGTATCHDRGPATISDGMAESSHDVEIHTTVGRNAITAAWHVVIEGKLPKELRSPHGKTLSVRTASGGQGVGTLVDPSLIRGAGEPPS